MDVPMRSEDRLEQHPIVFGGGPVLTANPEPYSAFFDVVLLGDGEDLIADCVAAAEANRGRPRLHKLVALSQASAAPARLPAAGPHPLNLPLAAGARRVRAGAV